MESEAGLLGTVTVAYKGAAAAERAEAAMDDDGRRAARQAA
jgi:hypothetical protein